MRYRIEPVTPQNRQKACGLHVALGQEGFIETVHECLMEAAEVPCWRPVLLCLEETAVGFAMYGLWEDEPPRGRVWLDRLLIDARYQGQGLATAFLPRLIRRIRKAYACGTLYLSVYPENRTAIRLYERFGFRPNGEREVHGEHVMVLEFEGSEPDNGIRPGKEEAG